ncbi:MAG: hypothetical protein JSV33_10050 [bacterium]|nr:MAG: hypothetical protein JSV33_10050 [bacterium]
MKRKESVLLLCLIVVVTGCMPRGAPRIKAGTSAGVDRIPTEIGIFPLLSTPVGRYGRRGIREAVKMEVRRRAEDIVIVPPTEMELKVTQESQIMTGMLSTDLSAAGFSLKELPVEVAPGWNDPEHPRAKRDAFMISLDLLDEIRDRYGIEALLVGNAFFLAEHYSGLPPERRVTFAHIKVIDIETLDILAQATFPYDSYGDDVEIVTERIALSLAEMAGLVVE